MGKSAVKASKKESKKVSKKESKKVESSASESSSSESSSSSSESSSESEAEEEKEEKKAESSSESSSDEEDEKKKDSSDSDSDSDSESEKEKKAESGSDSDSDSESEAESEEKDSKKRKAEDSESSSSTETPEPEAKKAKTESESEPATIFVGRLSWNIDDEWLKNEFEHIGGVIGARVLTERATGRSKGYGYVDFENKELAEKAVAEMNGKEVDGREINVDMSNYKKPTPGERSNDRAKTFRDQKSDPSDTLFIGNLSFDSNRDSVTEFFSQQGTILGVRLPTHPETEQPKGFGYVQFASVDEAKAALEALNGEYLDNRPVRLDFSTPRPPQQDRGFQRGGDRGGFGGRGGARGGRGGFNRGGDRGGFNRGGDRGGFNRGGSGANSTPVSFKGNKKTFD